MRTYTVITVNPLEQCPKDDKPAGLLFQYDYGQRLVFGGVDLPQAYEVHFSNQRMGKSVTVIGDVTGVDIPDEMLLTGQDVHVWLYLHQGEDDGETVYYARIAVRQRAKPTHETPTPVQQDEITQAIAALNAAVESTEADAASAEASAEDAGRAQAAAEAAQDRAEAAQGAAESAQTGAETAQDKAEDAQEAAEGARDRAETAAEAAETSAGTAEDAKTLAVAAQAAAEGSADAAAGSATAASGAASTAGTYALKSEGYAVGKQNGEPVGQESPYYHGNAAYYAGEAGVSAQTASGSATAAAGSANTASGAAGTATAAASTATAAKTAAESAQTGAVAAQTAAEAAQAAAESARDVLLNMIDDTAGPGDTTKAWSADKSSSELSELKSAIDRKAPVINQTASGDIVSFADGADGMPLSAVVQIDPVQSGSGDPAPDNVRPITGWTGAQISRTGRNLLDVTATGAVSDYTYHASVTKSEGTVAVTATGTWSALRLYRKLKAGAYTLNVGSISASDGGYSGMSVYNYDTNTQVVSGTLPFAFTLAEDAIIDIRFLASNGTSSDRTVTFTGIQLETGSTAHAYTPYVGQTYPISWQTAAGTVYGGNLTVNRNGTGTLIKTYENVDLSTLNWHLASGGYFAVDITMNYNPSATQWWVPNGLCDRYKVVASHYVVNATDRIDKTITWVSSQIRVADSSYQDAASFKASLTGAMIAYKLYVPADGIELDPVEITTLRESNIWADTGAISVTYPADTKTYVDDHTPVQDVQINGTSILSNGVANVPIANDTTPGVVKVVTGNGLAITSGMLSVNMANAAGVKAGTNTNTFLRPSTQDASAFYGLAKAAGADMASSSNPVGTYTEAAKVAIQKMIEPQFRLLADITLAEQAKSIAITVDPNGLPYTVKEITMQMVVEVATDSGNLAVGIGDGTPGSDDVPYLVIYNALSTSSKQTRHAHMEVRGGMFFGTATGGNTGTSYTPQQLYANKNSMGMIQATDIQRINIRSVNSYYIPSGTKILIYGR